MIDGKQVALMRQSYWSREEYPGFDEKRLAILEGLRMGNTRAACIAIVNVSRMVFEHWMLYEEAWRQAVEKAEALSEVELVSGVRSHVGKDWRAGMALLQLRHKEQWASTESQLAQQRAEVEKQKIQANLAIAQARELTTRSARNEKEASMWDQQFVTEEKQESMIQELASAVNRPLLSLTPEKLQELLVGKTYEEQLETLKGYLGREQSAIVEEVLSRSETTGEEQGEDDRED